MLDHVSLSSITNPILYKDGFKRIGISVINVSKISIMSVTKRYIDQSLCIETMKQYSVIMGTTVAILFVGLFTITTVTTTNVQASQGFFGKLSYIFYIFSTRYLLSNPESRFIIHNRIHVFHITAKLNIQLIGSSCVTQCR